MFPREDIKFSAARAETERNCERGDPEKDLERIAAFHVDGPLNLHVWGDAGVHAHVHTRKWWKACALNLMKRFGKLNDIFRMKLAASNDSGEKS